MIRITDVNNFHAPSATVVTLGKFDGLHKGHRKLIRRVREIAKEKGLAPCVFTFTVSPQVFLGERPQKLLTTNQERTALLREMEISLLAECPFTEEIRQMEAGRFIREVLMDRLQASAVVAGDDFCFGKDRQGNAEFLKNEGEKLGLQVEILPKERFEGRVISSTLVRQELEKGRMETVQKLLGYPFFITGEIVHGRHLGHTLGFPTINQIPPEEKMLPPSGVYFSRTLVGGKWYAGVSNVGTKPTVDGRRLGNETYLFDCNLDLYGLEARVELHHFRRPERQQVDGDGVPGA